MITEEDNFLMHFFELHENALCEEDETMDSRLAAIEDVLCEFDEKLNGGE